VATPAVGEDIESTCAKCGGLVWHVVVAKVGEKIAKVQCKRCHTSHRPRSTDPHMAGTAKVQKVRGAAGTTTPRAKREPAAPALPDVAFDASVPPRPYRASERFEVGQRLTHPTFGVGVVAKSTNDGKIEVRFDTEMRTLAQARAASTLERRSVADAATFTGVSDAPQRNKG